MSSSTSRQRFAKRSLGQNFLVDEAVIERILRALGPSADDIVVEIGPGRGALTEKLVQRAAKVYALEFDRDLAPLLRERLGVSGRLVVLEDDALSFDFRELAADGDPLRLVANLPYNISTAILQRLFEFRELFSDLVLMFQREVVERITAAPGTRDRGYLSVLTEASFHVERLFDVPPGAFRPVPKVWSAVVSLRPKGQNPFDDPRCRTLVSTAFAQKRKTILNNLKSSYSDAAGILDSAGIDPKRRAETLTLDEWTKLARVSRVAEIPGETTAGPA